MSDISGLINTGDNLTYAASELVKNMLQVQGDKGYFYSLIEVLLPVLAFIGGKLNYFLVFAIKIG